MSKELLENIVDYYQEEESNDDLSFKEIDNQIDKIRKDIWLELNNNLTALEKVRIINYFMFDVLKFQKNTTSPSTNSLTSASPPTP